MGTNLKDGDVYFWRWKAPKDFMPYHCRSQIAVVENGVLKDTFWSSGGERMLRPEDIETEYQGNIHEMTEIREYEVDYYRPEDVVDMRHSNSSRAKIYAKPGAARNADCMLAHIQYRIERAQSEIRSAESLIERLREEETKIKAGELEEIYL